MTAVEGDREGDAAKGARHAYAIAILWSSFLVAALAEFAIFGVVYPAAVRLPAGETLSRPASYTIAFFGFWILGALSSSLSLYLARDTGSPTSHA